MITIGALLAFVAIQGYAGVIALSTPAGSDLPPLITSDKVAYVATALTGLVSSIVAAAFGVPLAEGERTQGRTRVARLERITGISGPSRSPRTDWRSGFVTVYVLAYLCIASLGLGAWMFAPAGTPGYTQSLALVGFGVTIAIVNSFLVPTDADGTTASIRHSINHA